MPYKVISKNVWCIVQPGHGDVKERKEILLFIIFDQKIHDGIFLYMKLIDTGKTSSEVGKCLFVESKSLRNASQY